MPPIWDEPPDPGFAPLPYPSVPQYGPPPMLPPTSDPNLFAEMQGQQEQMPNDFWARLAQGAGPSPFGQPTVPNKPTGLEVLLAIAQGFGNAKAGQGAKRVDETTARNARARDAAKTLAMWRHDERKAAQLARDNRELLGMKAPPSRGELKPVMEGGKRIYRYPDEAAGKEAPAPGEYDSPGLGPEAIEMAAVTYITTGVMPALGMRNNKAREAILNRAGALLSGGGGSVPSNIASFRSSMASRTAIQRMFDSSKAFETTAIKNFDILENRMKAIPDTGSPWLNTPIRRLGRGGLGSAELAAFNAAKAVVAPEFARLLQSPTMAGQLTDEARKELNEIIAGNYSMNQMLAVGRVLRQDAKNRTMSYEGQLKEIDDRIKGLGVPAGGGATSPAPGGKVRMQSSDGTQTGLVDASERAAAEKNGWKVVQ